LKKNLEQDILAPLKLEIAVVQVAANKETTWTVPIGAVNVKMQCRTAVGVKAATKQGEVVNGSQYWTIKSGTVDEEFGLAVEPGTVIYLGAASVVAVEIKLWRRVGA